MEKTVFDTEKEPCGVLVLDKPQGITSHDAVYKIRRLFGTKKVGHAGTLDPMATGVLIMLIGRATKAAEFAVSGVKRYEARMKLGVETDTLDVTGAVVRECGDIPGETAVLTAVGGFVGTYGQVPPMYSAIKKDGRKLVDLARRGVTLDLEPREITVYSIAAARLTDDEYSLSIACSAGTYVRSLCRDIGAKLGCGAAMSALRRTASGGFHVTDAVTLETLEATDPDKRIAFLRPVECLFSDLDELRLPDFFAALARSGQHLYQKKLGVSIPTGRLVRLSDRDGFFAVAESRERIEDGASVPVIKPVKQY